MLLGNDCVPSVYHTFIPASVCFFQIHYLCPSNSRTWPSILSFSRSPTLHPAAIVDHSISTLLVLTSQHQAHPLRLDWVFRNAPWYSIWQLLTRPTFTHLQVVLSASYFNFLMPVSPTTEVPCYFKELLPRLDRLFIRIRPFCVQFDACCNWYEKIHLTFIMEVLLSTFISTMFCLVKIGCGFIRTVGVRLGSFWQ